VDGTCIGRVPGFVVAVVCGRARDGNGCLVPADRLGAADQFTDPTGLFRSVCLPRIRCCSGEPAGFPSFSGFRNHEAVVFITNSRARHTGTRRRAAAMDGLCPGTHPGLLGRVDRWPAWYARISCPFTPFSAAAQQHKRVQHLHVSWAPSARVVPHRPPLESTTELRSNAF